MHTISKRGLLPEPPDLEVYFRRVGYAGPRTATFDTLAALHRLHPQAIPFENLDTLLRRPVALDAAAFERKMLAGGRGGWCFEHNLNGETEQVTLGCARDLRAALEGELGIVLPDDAGLDAVLERFAKR